VPPLLGALVGIVCDGFIRLWCRRPLCCPWAGTTVAPSLVVAGARLVAVGFGLGETDRLAGALNAAWLILVERPFPDVAIRIPSVILSAADIARATAPRAVRLRPARRRHAPRCRVDIEFTSVVSSSGVELPSEMLDRHGRRECGHQAARNNFEISH
jgi:hypothetical protein